MSTQEPEMSRANAEATIETTASAPRVTKEHLDSIITNVEYLFSNIHSTLTICVLHLRNGFTVIGKSAPVYKDNFVKEVGERFAYDDAFKQLWQLEGYVLAERRRESW